MENLRVYASYFPELTRRPLQPFLTSLLEFVSLADRANSKIETLSGGMKRRLAIARALVNEPELLILDEPTTGLDPQIRHLIWSRLRQLVQKGTTVWLTTHYMEEAERLCDRVAIIDHGQILTEDSPQELIAQKVEPHVVEVLAQGQSPPTELTQIARVEDLNGVWHCYTNDPTKIVEYLQRHSKLEYKSRWAHLEDVFLHLTGRELKE